MSLEETTTHQEQKLRSLEACHVGMVADLRVLTRLPSFGDSVTVELLNALLISVLDKHEARRRAIFR